MKRIASLLLLALILFTACQEKDLYEPTEPKEQKDFNLFDEITVSSNLPTSTACLLFTSFPYNEDGDLVEEPVMVAYAPFNKEIRIPKAVSKLYTYVNGVVTEHGRGDINLTSGAVTRTANFTPAENGTTKNPGDSEWTQLSEAFITKIYSYYPEGQKNATGDELTICTDLYAPEGVKGTYINDKGETIEESWGPTKVWITYIGAGGTTFKGDLWYYTYEVDENKVPITPLSEIKQNKVQIFNRAHDTNVQPADGTGKRVYLGEFAPGTRIGFSYYGNSNEKYSTPYYNKQNGKIENTCGIIRTWEYEGREFATIGMENKLTTEGSDLDFNDMVCLIEANPICVENKLDPPTPTPESIKWQGYWLFEDNYPAQGDYDFNDLVVKYAITEMTNEAIIDLMFVARGALFNNSFGVNGTIYMRNLKGYENVRLNEPEVEPVVQQIRLPISSSKKYIPMLNNGEVSFDLNTFYELDTDFPCVLDIPVVANQPFQWCIESTRIDDAYPRYNNWVGSKCKDDTDWYLDTPVAGTTWSK